MGQNGDAVVAGQPQLLAVPLADDGVQIHGQLTGVGYVYAPVCAAHGVAHAESHELFFRHGQLDGVGLGGGRGNVAFPGAGLGDVVELRLFDGRQLHAHHQLGELRLQRLHIPDGLMQIAHEGVVIKIQMVGDAQLFDAQLSGRLENLAQGEGGIVGGLGVDMPVRVNDHKTNSFPKAAWGRTGNSIPRGGAESQLFCVFDALRGDTLAPVRRGVLYWKK